MIFSKCRARLVFPLLAVAFGFAPAARSADTALDPGGVTFDFKENSDERLKARSDDAAANLIENGNFRLPLSKDAGPDRWMGSPAYVHIANRERAREIEPRLTGLPVFRVADIEGGKAGLMTKPAAMEEIAGDDMKDVSGGWRYIHTLSDTAGGTYTLTYRYHSRATGKSPITNKLVLSCTDGSGTTPSSGKSVGEVVVKVLPATAGDEFQSFHTDFEVPQNAKYLFMLFRLDGMGDLTVTDVVLTQKKKPVTSP